MSERVKLSAKLRTSDFGSAGSRRLVRAGYIPAVIYGGKSEPIHVAVVAKEFLMKMHTFTGTTIIELDVDGTVHHVFVKTFQENLLKGIVQHIDFFQVTAGEKLRANVLVELEGTPVGCRNGGVLEQVIAELDIECLPKDLPEAIKVDVSKLDIGDVLRVGQIAVPAGVKVHTPEDATVATLKLVKEEAPAEAAPAADEAAPVAESTETK